jgi:hypothetical protein
LIEAHFLSAYLNTTYRVFFPEEAVDIRIGECQSRLDELLGGQSWAFISAENPGSIPVKDNADRHGKLVERLKGRDSHPGLGIPDEGDWPPEKSLLVCGISEQEAIRIGRQFGQNAILCGEPGKPARLVPLSGQALRDDFV